MNLPAEKYWGNKWQKNDLEKILRIARGLRARHRITDRMAWHAAEKEYVSTQAPGLRRSMLHARLQ